MKTDEIRVTRGISMLYHSKAYMVYIFNSVTAQVGNMNALSTMLTLIFLK